METANSAESRAKTTPRSPACGQLRVMGHVGLANMSKKQVQNQQNMHACMASCQVDKHLPVATWTHYEIESSKVRKNHEATFQKFAQEAFFSF